MGGGGRWREITWPSHSQRRERAPRGPPRSGRPPPTTARSHERDVSSSESWKRVLRCLPRREYLRPAASRQQVGSSRKQSEAVASSRKLSEAVGSSRKQSEAVGSNQRRAGGLPSTACRGPSSAYERRAGDLPASRPHLARISRPPRPSSAFERRAAYLVATLPRLSSAMPSTAVSGRVECFSRSRLLERLRPLRLGRLIEIHREERGHGRRWEVVGGGGGGGRWREVAGGGAREMAGDGGRWCEIT